MLISARAITHFLLFTCPLVLCSDSCQRGWRLLYILTAFHRCSEVLKPFLLKYLQQASRSAGTQYQGIAKACEQNLKRTYQFGGRTVAPNSMELKAMMAGRSSKRQLFLFPGGIERHVKLKTCSVSVQLLLSVHVCKLPEGFHAYCTNATCV
uniref:MyTH4 domain-containing protein n=1 Tax=Acanthochromis polyacanthus TaxID=80966 RepID=A0A3Q1GWU1_9TELE